MLEVLLAEQTSLAWATPAQSGTAAPLANEHAHEFGSLAAASPCKHLLPSVTTALLPRKTCPKSLRLSFPSAAA